MKTTTALAFTIGTLFSTISFAQAACTNVASANIDNIATCPKTVKEEIWMKVAKPATVADIGNKIIIVDKHGNLASPTDWSNIYYLTTRNGKVCVGEAYPHSSYSSVAENGALGLSSGTGKCAEKEAYRLDRVRNWNGNLIQSETFGDWVIYPAKPVYPIARKDAEDIIANPKSYFWQKVDALASVIKDMPAPSQATIIMDVLGDVGVRASVDVIGVFKKLSALKDPRTNEILMDLLNDGIVMKEVKSALLKTASLTEASPALLDFVKNELSVAGCEGSLNESLVLFGKAQNVGVKNAMVGLLSRCASFSKDSFYYWFTSAMNIIGSEKILAGTLPVMELLNNYATSEMPKNIAGEYKQMLISAINALSSLASERALETLKNPYYYNCMHAEIAQAARNAVKNIEATALIKKIAQGDLDAIKWGMDMISFHNGSARPIQFQILDAFIKTMKLSLSLKTKIKAFLQNEIDQGYHAYDEELVAKMQSLLEL